MIFWILLLVVIVVWRRPLLSRLTRYPHLLALLAITILFPARALASLAKVIATQFSKNAETIEIAALWATALRWPYAQIVKFLQDVQALEELPTIRRGMEALQMRSIIEWYWYHRRIREAGCGLSAYKQRPYFFFPGLRAREFYDPNEFPWVAALESKADVIRRELHQLLKDSQGFQSYRNELGLYHHPGQDRRDDVKPYQKGDWRLFYFFRSGHKVDANCRFCPETTAALESIPSLEKTMICFSVLEPGRWIPPHTGSFNGILRVHLGLDIPDGCVIRVGDQTRTWQQGKVLIFDDSYVHEVWNHSNQTRVVLFINIMHPDFSEEEAAYAQNFIKTSLMQTPIARLWESVQNREHSRGGET